MKSALSANARANRLGAAMTVFILTTVVSQNLLNLLISRTLPALAAHDAYIWLLSTVPLYLLALPLAWLILRRIPSEPSANRQSIKPKLLTTLATIVICFGLMYVGSMIGNLLMSAANLLFGIEMANPVYAVLEETHPLFNFIATVIIAPLGEEFIFRRLLIDRTRCYGDRAAILFSAAAFAAFHLNLFQFFYAFLLGLVFAYIYTKTGRLRYSIALHALINLFGGTIAMQMLKAIEGLLTMQEPDPALILETLPALLLYLSYAGFLMLAAGATLVLGIAYHRTLTFIPGTEPAAALPRSIGVILFFACCAAISVLMMG